MTQNFPTWDDLWNLDVENCPITSCSIYENQNDGYSCDPDGDGLIPFSGSEIQFSGLDLMASTASTPGYSYTVCVRCTNGYMNRDRGNWDISQSSQCDTTFTVSDDLLAVYEFQYTHGEESIYLLENLFIN